MHEILLPRNRRASIRASYRHPDQAAILARIPIARRRLPFRRLWQHQSIDPRRMASHSAEYVR